MLLIALTGGIASGKSVVAARFAELGAVHVDADVLAREVVQPGTPGLAAIAAEFGERMIAADGSLDRAALGAVVFGDPEKLARLNAITHPEVRRLARERFSAAEAADADAVVVYDVPLFVEAGRAAHEHFDLVVVTHAEASVRLDRMTRLRGMSREEAERRVSAQASDADRLAVADVVIDTGGTLEHTTEQVDDLWARIIAGEFR
jgi:dephospho-CoA kinase